MLAMWAHSSLFLKVRDNGIGNLRPKFLRFNCNFRSDKSIVEWVNQFFKKIFPKNDDINFGAMAYLPSTAEAENENDAQLFTSSCVTQETQTRDPSRSSGGSTPSTSITTQETSSSDLSRSNRCSTQERRRFMNTSDDLQPMPDHSDPGFN